VFPVWKTRWLSCIQVLKIDIQELTFEIIFQADDVEKRNTITENWNKELLDVHLTFYYAEKKSPTLLLTVFHFINAEKNLVLILSKKVVFLRENKKGLFSRKYLVSKKWKFSWRKWITEKSNPTINSTNLILQWSIHNWWLKHKALVKEIQKSTNQNNSLIGENEHQNKKIIRKTSFKWQNVHQNLLKTSKQYQTWKKKWSHEKSNSTMTKQVRVLFILHIN
jgi:hypothetical protein